jgi:diguanylate cyclase (GGDEF)-like protein/PAS domain S-box-containing protein
MDIRLIDAIDGIDAAEIIQEEYDIPVVYLTAHSDKNTLERAKRTCPFGYILKPFQEKELYTTIEIALYKHQVQKELKQNARWLAAILESIGDGVITTDTESQITFINSTGENITGWSFAEAIGKKLSKVFRLIYQKTRQIVNISIQQIQETGKTITLLEPIILIKKNGQELSIDDSIAPIYKQANNLDSNTSITSDFLGIVCIFRNITQQKLTIKQLHRQAFFDDLTNLANRAWFRERLTDAIARSKRNTDYLFAVLLLDLDRFKIVNDTLGHEFGDRLLKAVAFRLRESVRPMNTVASLGGDEFAILLESIHTTNEALYVAQRINQELSKSFKIQNHELLSNASIGIVLSSIDYEEVDEIIRDTDIAMYRAKAKSRNCSEVFNPFLRQELLTIARTENEL